MAEADSGKHPSLPPNYVSIAQLQERWLKEKQRKQQEKEKHEKEEEKKHLETALLQNHQKHQNHSANRSIRSGKNLHKPENHVRKSWREVGLIAKEPKLKEVKFTSPAAQEGEKNKKKGYFQKGAILERGMAVVSVENSVEESSKGTCKWNSKNKEVNKITASVVDEGSDGTSKIIKKEKEGSFGKWKPRFERDGRDMAKVSTFDVSGEEIKAAVSVEIGGKESSKGKCTWISENKVVEEVATACTVEAVEENKVDREIAWQKRRVGFKGKKNMVGEVSDKADGVEQSGKERNAEKEKVSVDVIERTNEKARMRGTFCTYSDKGVEEVATICTVEVVGDNEVDREIGGQKRRVGFKGRKNSWRKRGGSVGDLDDKIDSAEQSGQEHNEEKEELSVDVKERTNEKVRMGGAFCAYIDKEVKKVATVCTAEVVGEDMVGRDIAGQRYRVGFSTKMGGRFGEVSDSADKTDSTEQSGKEHNAEKEKVSVDVKERTNEKVRVRGAFQAYGSKSNDVPLVDSEAGLKTKTERDLGRLSLSDRRYCRRRPRRYEPRKMLKKRDSSFVWVKKGESSNANVAEIETQVDVSSQSKSE